MAIDHTWEARVDAFWERADDTQPEACLAAMRRLVDEHPGEARATYEWASVHDFLGRESEAIPLYQAALAGGLEPEIAHQATVQLASSLRNVGRAVEAIRLLEALDAPELGAAPDAFRALALRDAGRTDEALALTLTRLADTLPLYGRAIAEYAQS